MPKTPPSPKELLLTHLDWNIQQLGEALKQGTTEYYKSAALQRFGHSYLMALKTIHSFSNQKTETDEKECIELANQNGWTEDKSQWDQMVNDFKSINQKPNLEQVESIYEKLPAYEKELKKLRFS